jgi:hypothetical protein
MRTLAVAVVTALIASCATAPSPAPPTATSEAQATLRVMTYNIFAGNDLERQSNLARIAALIDSLSVDVVLGLHHAGEPGVYGGEGAGYATVGSPTRRRGHPPVVTAYIVRAQI